MYGTAGPAVKKTSGTLTADCIVDLFERSPGGDFVLLRKYFEPHLKRTLGEEETRIGVVLQLVKTDEACPECNRNEGLIRLTGILERFDEYTLCRHCGRQFQTQRKR